MGTIPSKTRYDIETFNTAQVSQAKIIEEKRALAHSYVEESKAVHVSRVNSKATLVSYRPLTYDVEKCQDTGAVGYDAPKDTFNKQVKSKHNISRKLPDNLKTNKHICKAVPLDSLSLADIICDNLQVEDGDRKFIEDLIKIIPKNKTDNYAEKMDDKKVSKFLKEKDIQGLEEYFYNLIKEHPSGSPHPGATNEVALASGINGQEQANSTVPEHRPDESPTGSQDATPKIKPKRVTYDKLKKSPYQSIGMVYWYRKDDIPPLEHFGTAFYIGNGKIVTAAHNFEKLSKQKGIRGKIIYLLTQQYKLRNPREATFIPALEKWGDILKDILEDKHEDILEDKHEDILEDKHKDILEDKHEDILEDKHEDILEDKHEDILEDKHEDIHEDKHKNNYISYDLSDVKFVNYWYRVVNYFWFDDFSSYCDICTAVIKQREEHQSSQSLTALPLEPYPEELPPDQTRKWIIIGYGDYYDGKKTDITMLELIVDEEYNNTSPPSQSEIVTKLPYSCDPNSVAGMSGGPWMIISEMENDNKMIARGIQSKCIKNDRTSVSPYITQELLREIEEPNPS